MYIFTLLCKNARFSIQISNFTSKIWDTFKRNIARFKNFWPVNTIFSMNT